MQKLVFINGAGNEIDLTAGNFGITNWAGLSNTGLNIQTQQVPFEDGGVFLDALMEQREIEVTVAIYDGNNLELRYQKKRELISALNPKLGEGTLIYTNDYLSRQIKAVPQIPLFENKNSNDAGTLKASVAFSCCNPYWEDLEDTVVTVLMGDNVTVENNGDVPTYPQIIIATENVTDPKVKNITTGKMIQYNGTLQKDLIIDTRYGKKNVYATSFNFNDALLFSYDVYDFIYCKEKELFIAVGRAILVSKDGVEWKIAKEMDASTLVRGVCYNKNNKKFYAVGYETVWSSSDGYTWNSIYENQEVHFLGIAYSTQNHAMVAVGTDEYAYAGYIYTSTDGETWTNTLSANNSLQGIIYDDLNNIFVIVGMFCIYTGSNGINWTLEDPVREFYSIYHDKIHSCYLVGGQGTIYKFAENDFSQYEEYTVCEVSSVFGVIYDEHSEVYFAICEYNEEGDRNITFTSEDLETWTPLDTYAKENKITLRKITYVNDFSKYFVAGYFGTIMTSHDLLTWVKVQGGYSNVINRICRSESRNVTLAVGGEYNDWGFVAYSYDDVNWNVIRNNFAQNVDCIYSKKQDKFVVCGHGYGILVSTDLENWITVGQEGTPSSSNCCAYSEELDLFVNGEGGHLSYSNDAINWTWAENVYSNYDFVSICYSKKLGLFVAITYRGDLIYTSTDGIHWNHYGILDWRTLRWNRICYSEELELFVAVGDTIVSVSQDGINFTHIPLAFISGMNDVIYEGNNHRFVAVGINGKLVASYDGYTWSLLYTESRSLTVCVCENKSKNYLMIGCSPTKIVKSTDEKINVIQNLNSDSNMNFSFDVGSNIIQLTKTSGSMNVILRYRQKYIGV